MHSAVGVASIFRENAPRSGNPALGARNGRGNRSSASVIRGVIPEGRGLSTVPR